MWWERSSRIARRSSCGRSHQAADFRIGIKAARVADGLPRLSWRPSKRERSARVTSGPKLVTPVRPHPPIGCFASSSVTSSRDIQARGRPLTGSPRRTRQDPTLLPTNHVRVANASSPPATTLHCCKLRRLDIANRPVGHSTRTDPSVSADSGPFSVTLYTVAPIPEGLVRGGSMVNRIARSFLIGTMAFVLLALTPLSAQASQGLTHVEHPNVLVTIDPEASSQNEVTIAAFPSDRNILVATARDTRQASGFSWAGYYRSTDGGDTWQNALVPGFPGDTSPEGLSSPVNEAGWKIGSDTAITPDHAGRVYLAWLSFGPTTTEFAGWLVLTRYSNFGATYDFTSVVFAGHDTPSDKLGGPGNSRVTDKEWIAVDDTGGTCDGNVYIPWAFFEGSHGTKIVLQRSSDGGLSWTPIISLSHSPNSQNQGATVAVGPGGEVYVAWEDFHKDQILFTRSLDCGQTFDVEQGIASIVPVPEPLPGSAYRLDSFPRMAVSQTTGSIFMTWADYRSGDADVLLARSTGGGAAFLGDYNGIASNAAGAHPIWADNRNVSINALRDQDIYTATIS